MYRFKLTSTFLFLMTILLPLQAAQVQIGNSYKEVLQKLGTPDGDLNAGSKRMLTYGKAKIKFQQDKVYWISPELENLMAQRSIDQANVGEKRAAGLVNFRGKWVTPAQREQVVQAELEDKKAKMAKNADQRSSGWLTDYLQAASIARSQNKKLLLNFTGSDWCGWCIKLDQEVFSKQEFLDYAQDHYVLVKLDFPKRSKLAPSLAQQNQALAQKHGVRGFPTIVVLKSNGKAYKQSGYVKGGPKAFLNSIK